MEITIFKDQLNKAISTVYNAKPKQQTTNPILEGILIQTDKDNIKLTAHDPIIGIQAIANCDVHEEGAIVINANIFNEIIKKLPNTMIELTSVGDNLVKISCEGSEFVLNTMNANEYPELELIEMEEGKCIEIEQSILKNMIKKTSFAISQDNSRTTYLGALFEIKDNTLYIVALDGFRMAVQTQILNQNVADFKTIIPARTLSELTKILDDSNIPVTFGVNNNNAIFHIPDASIVTTTVEGNFIDFRSTIPTVFNTTIKINRTDFINALDRINLLSSLKVEREKTSAIKFEIDIDKIILSCINKVGNAKEQILVETDGQNLIAGFNPRFFIEALKAIDDEEVLVEFTTDIKPCIMRSQNKTDFIYMILPIKLNS